MSEAATLPPEIAACSAEVREHFRSMIANGMTERFAIMCALQQPPGTRGTDRAFMEGRYGNEWMKNQPQALTQRMLSDAKKAGISTSGKFYMGGIADARGHCDPEAWVDSTADVLRVAQKRDLEVHGIVEYVPPAKAPQKEVDINPRILREHVRKELKENPQLSRGEATEKVKDRIVPHWKRKK
jgi:hypothetical protein